MSDQSEGHEDGWTLELTPRPPEPVSQEEPREEPPAQKKEVQVPRE